MNEARRGGDTGTGIDVRLGTPADATEAASVLSASLQHLAARQGRPGAPVPPADVIPVLEHLAGAQAEGFVVAVDGDRIAGFAASSLRGAVWYLAGLFVLPEYQGIGLGQRLVTAVLPGRAQQEHAGADPACAARGGARPPAPAPMLSVVSSGSNPVSNLLYARNGMYPWLPMLYLEAGASPRIPEPAQTDLEPSPLNEGCLPELSAIDAVVTCTERAADHLWKLRQGHAGWVFRRDGRAVAYAFLGGDGTLGPGQMGPAAALEAADVGPVLRFALGRIEPAQPVSVMVPGANIEAQRVLWGCGFGLKGATALLGVSRPFGRFDRYVAAGNVLL